MKNRKTKKLCIVILILAAVIAVATVIGLKSCGAEKAENNDETHAVILATSDMHANIRSSVPWVDENMPVAH